tara:strand:- start:141480 stop:143015 length:1536 start_codon:yes stop_codon:yes gene_type:complete
MKKHFLIKLAVLTLVITAYGCSSKDDTEQDPARVGTVTINPIATDDVIDANESTQATHTISGTAIGGSIEADDSVIVAVNGASYTTIVEANGIYSVEVATNDLLLDNSVDVSVVSNIGAGNSVTSKASRTITVNTSTGTKTFVHPGLLVKQSDFDRIKSKVNAGTEPWVSGWNKLTSNTHASLSYNPNPVVKLIRGGNSLEESDPDNYGNAFNDTAAAFQCAIRWKVTGDTAYADKATQILNEWASTCTSLSGDPNIGLLGIYGYQFANAAEIMRTYEGWSSADFEAFKTWMTNLFYPLSKDLLDTHYGTCSTFLWASWDLLSLANIMSIAVLTDDQEKYDYTINYLKTGIGNGNLNRAINYIHPNGLGQLQESGRDQGHTLLSVGLLGEIAQMAYSQGDDIFGYDDNRILKGAEYAAKYNVANLGVPFESYNNCDNANHTVVSGDARGNVRPIWDLLYYHYVVRKGLTSQYLKFAAEAYGSIEGGGGDYGPNSGGFDSLGFGTLLYAIEE